MSHFLEKVLNYCLSGGGRTRKRFVGFGDFFVGLSVKSSKFERLSVKGKCYGVGDLAVFVRFFGKRIKSYCQKSRFPRNDYP